MSRNFLDTKQAAALFDVSPSYFRRWAKEQGIEPVCIQQKGFGHGIRGSGKKFWLRAELERLKKP